MSISRHLNHFHRLPWAASAAMALLGLLPSAGCHLFADAYIERTCEDLPLGCGGTVDTSSTDTSDSGQVPIEYGSHMVLGVQSGDQLAIEVYSPEGDLAATMSVQLTALTNQDLDAALGPVAYDPDNGVFYFYDNVSMQVHIMPESGSSVELDAYYSAQDILIMGGIAYLGVQYYVFSFDPLLADGLDLATFETYFYNVEAVFPAYDDSLYVVSLGLNDDDLPDLYRGDTTSKEVVLAYEDFDDGQNRAQDGFSGPDGQPFVCSIAGAVYRIEDLAMGDRTPVAFPSEVEMEQLFGSSVLSDVVDCGWDDLSGRYLLLSRSAGLLSIDEWGSVDSIRVAPDGSSFFRAAFY